MIGNLTRDPDYKTLPSGQSVCRLGIAVNRSFRNKATGATTQEVCYIDIDVWGTQAESCRQYLQKGRSILVEGRLKLDSWQDQTGAARSKHSIVADRITFLGQGQNTETGLSDFDVESVTTNGFDGLKTRSSDFGQAFGNDVGSYNAPSLARSKKKNGKDISDAFSTSSGELDFKDEPPFEDLPF
jgi:single-strand DNA-binding protein